MGDLVVREAAANLVRADPVAAVEESSAPVVQEAEIMVADLVFLAVVEIGREDPAMEIGPAVREAEAIDPVDLEMAIALVARVMEIVPADPEMVTIDRDVPAIDPVKVAAVSNGALAIVQAVGPIGRTDQTIGRGAIRIGTSRRTGGTIVGRT